MTDLDDYLASIECEICRRLLAIFSDHGGKGTFKEEHFSDAQVSGDDNSQCLCHGDFFRLCRERLSLSNFQGKGIRTQNRSGGVVEVRVMDQHSDLLHVVLIKEGDVVGHPGQGRYLDPDWFDLGLAREWKLDCSSLHGTGCQRHASIPRAKPTYLIDTCTNSLVPSADKPYVCLSYRWGETGGLRTCQSNLEMLQKPDSLCSTEIASKISPIVKRAMHVVREMGERYLWADVLCIIQDDMDNFSAHLNMMGSIYASAEFTIVAADGDATSGLPGLRGVSPPRGILQTFVPLGPRGDKIAIHDTGMGAHDMTDGLPYFERGWTYQEYYMSRRRLVFRKNTLHWECQCNVWYENLARQPAGGGRIMNHTARPMQTILDGAVDLDELWIILSNYNERVFRYNQDALPGITGMLSVLSRTIRGGFLFGLPEAMFDTALAWQARRPRGSLYERGDLRRRVAASGTAPDTPGMAHSVIPSWSWVGWTGMVKFPHAENGLRQLHFPRLFAGSNQWLGVHFTETIPITQWFTAEQASGHGRRAIRATWFRLRDQLKAATKSPVDGWTFEETHMVDIEATGAKPGRGGHLLKDNHTIRTCYPPAGDTSSPAPSPQTPYLFCKTTRTKLQAIEGGDDKILLCDKAGAGVGKLVVNSLGDLDAILAPGAQVELVAICRQLWFTAVDVQHGFKVDSDRYVVLWVEWVDGVAYRKGTGYIETGDWEKLDLEEVNLTLG